MSTNSNNQSGIGSFDGFNEHGDIFPYMVKDGWTVLPQDGDISFVIRPGGDKPSGNFHHGYRTLYIHTTESNLKQGKHTPSQVFIELECNGNQSEASHRLLDLGYGTFASVSSNNKDKTVIDDEEKYKYLLEPLTREKVKLFFSRRSENLYSGFTIKGNKIYYPSGALSVFAAATGHGKTSGMANSALDIASEKNVCFIGYEEDPSIVLAKLLSIYIAKNSKIPFDYLSNDNFTTLSAFFRSGSLTSIAPDDIDGWSTNEKRIANFLELENNFFTKYMDTGRIRIIPANHGNELVLSELIKSIKFLNDKSDLGAVFIDYIQLITIEGKHRNRQEEIKEICKRLENIAHEIGKPLILGSQFNRNVKRQTELQLTNSSEAADIEKKAKLYLACWNHDTPENTTDLDENELTDVPPQNKMTIRVLKNSFGRVAGMKETLFFDGNTGAIKNNDPIESTGSDPDLF